MSERVWAPVKVAFRGEAEWVVAYVAETGGEWRYEIGRISRRICDERKDVWELFKGVMRAGGFHIIEQVSGQKVESHEELPPEFLEGGWIEEN